MSALSSLLPRDYRREVETFSDAQADEVLERQDLPDTEVWQWAHGYCVARGFVGDIHAFVRAVKLELGKRNRIDLSPRGAPHPGPGRP